MTFIFSPLPLTRATSSNKQYAISLPKLAAISIISLMFKFSLNSLFKAMIVQAASLLPPPSPAWVGICFLIVISRPCFILYFFLIKLAVFKTKLSGYISFMILFILSLFFLKFYQRIYLTITDSNHDNYLLFFLRLLGLNLF